MAAPAASKSPVLFCEAVPRFKLAMELVVNVLALLCAAAAVPAKSKSLVLFLEAVPKFKAVIAVLIEVIFI